MSLFEKIRQGLEKTRNSLADSLDHVFGDYSEVDEDFFEDLTDALIMADMGAAAAQKITADIRKESYDLHIKDPEKVRSMLKERIAALLRQPEDAYAFEREKSILLFVGVNGVGKTTSVGKLASLYSTEGKKVLLCAADTYRAAAAEQLGIWAERTGVTMISQKEGADPASVVYDAVSAFRSRGMDMILCDTAGRLHNKKNLMAELSRIDRILQKELPGIKKEVLLVLDACTGQNAISQAREFARAADVTGIVLTKLDGTAKGGIVVAIAGELGIPVKFIGIGEGRDDLKRFDADAFAGAMLDRNGI